MNDDNTRGIEMFANAIGAGVPEDRARKLAEAVQSPTFGRSEHVYNTIAADALRGLAILTRSENDVVGSSIALRTGMDHYHVEVLRGQYGQMFPGAKLLEAANASGDPAGHMAAYLALAFTNGVFVGLHMAYALAEGDENWPYYG